jgi:flagellar assembly protein FliH
VVEAMMSTSKPGQPGGGSAPNPYARFIPREELGTFAAWHPETFQQPVTGDASDEGGVRKPTLAERAAAELRPTMKSGPASPAGGNAAAQSAAPGAGAAAPRPPHWRPIVGGVPGQAEAEAQAHADAAAQRASQGAPDVDALVEAARQSGYQDGYRNGLAALESYKQSQAEQMAHYMNEQVGALVDAMQQRLDALEQQLAGRVAGVSLELARQVVRSELVERPELVVDVAEQALSALLSSARQIVVRLHPEDHAVVQGRLDELLQSRGGRLVADATIARGGCLVDSDIALVDATVASRWERAAGAMGHQAPWQGGHESQVPTARQPSRQDEGIRGEWDKRGEPQDGAGEP